MTSTSAEIIAQKCTICDGDRVAVCVRLYNVDMHRERGEMKFDS